MFLLKIVFVILYADRMISAGDLGGGGGCLPPGALMYSAK